MSFLGLGKKTEKVEEVKTEIKSSTPSFVRYLFSTFGGGIGEMFLPPYTAYRFYHKISPVQGTVSKVCDAIASLPLVLRSEESPDEITKDHEVLELLNRPSGLTTKKQFFTLAAQSLMLTRELWVVSRGLESQKPVELSFIHPYNIEIVSDPTHIWPTSIYTNINGDRHYYYREDYKDRYRYFDRSRLNEMMPFVAERNVFGSSGYFRGISPLSAMKDELLSYSASILGNTATIENSGRPSGIISPKNSNMTPEQYEDLQESLEKTIGAKNSGQILLLPESVEAVFPQWAPKDMDYATLQDNVKHNLWNLYSMPLPIVSSKGQTYSNFTEAQTAFYDEAVNEIWEVLADALKWMLEIKYDLTGQTLSYNQFEVPALKRRAVRMMKEMTESNALSINEIRNSAGYDDDADGNEIIVPSGKTTLDNIIQGASFQKEATQFNTNEK